VLEGAGFVRRNESGQPDFAVAVVRQGKTLSEAQVMQQVQSRMRNPGLLRSVYFVDSLPKDQFDTVNRRSLQRQFSAR
jgi:hypothetical protein